MTCPPERTKGGKSKRLPVCWGLTSRGGGASKRRGQPHTACKGLWESWACDPGVQHAATKYGGVRKRLCPCRSQNLWEAPVVTGQMLGLVPGHLSAQVGQCAARSSVWPPGKSHHFRAWGDGGLCGTRHISKVSVHEQGPWCHRDTVRRAVWVPALLPGPGVAVPSHVTKWSPCYLSPGDICFLLTGPASSLPLYPPPL